jgi:hypothetical protein
MRPFQRHLATASNAKLFCFTAHRKSIELRQDMPNLKARQRQIQKPASPVSSTAKRREVDQQPLFADETWQIRGVTTLATSATQLEKGAASGRESLDIYKDKVPQLVNFVSHKSGTVAGSVSVLRQGHAPLFATSVA